MIQISCAWENYKYLLKKTQTRHFLFIFNTCPIKQYFDIYTGLVFIGNFSVVNNYPDEYPININNKTSLFFTSHHNIFRKIPVNDFLSVLSVLKLCL